MDVVVVACRDEVPGWLERVARTKVAKLGRFAPVLERAEVRLSRRTTGNARTDQVCEVRVSGHGHMLRARAAAPDGLAAVDLVIDKLEHQVERLKGKVISRTHPRRSRSGARR